jgi:predicted RNA-binding protein with PIN domain
MGRQPGVGNQRHDFTRRGNGKTAADAQSPIRYNRGMALLIDGYNLLHATDIFGEAGPGTELHRTRLAFLNFLARAISKRQRAQTTIVFDAAGAPPGLPRTIYHEDMTVHFAARHSEADEMIEDLLEQHPAPRSLTVVSSDRRVQRAARHRGAAYVDSSQWYADIRAAARQAREEQSAAEAGPAKDPGDVNYWIGQFGEAPSVDDDLNPFPPGYGDDLAEEA